MIVDYRSMQARICKSRLRLPDSNLSDFKGVILFGNARIGETDLYRGLSARKNERPRNGRLWREAAVGLRCRRWRRPRLQSQACNGKESTISTRYATTFEANGFRRLYSAILTDLSGSGDLRDRHARRRSPLPKAITCFCPCSGRIRIQANVVFCQCPISDEDASSSPACDYFCVQALHCPGGRCQHGITRSGSRSIPVAALPGRPRTAWKA
jgi:hypothetical protein